MGIVDGLSNLFGPHTQSEGIYQCQSCQALFDAQFHVCPNCGGYRVDRREWQLSD